MRNRKDQALKRARKAVGDIADQVVIRITDQGKAKIYARSQRTPIRFSDGTNLGKLMEKVYRATAAARLIKAGFELE